MVNEQKKLSEDILKLMEQSEVHNSPLTKNKTKRKKDVAYYLNKIEKLTSTSDECAEVKYNLFPIRDERAYLFYKMQLAAFWTSDELDFFKDLQDFNNFTPFERRVISLIHSFFSIADGYVSDLYAKRIMYDCESKEEEFFIMIQCTIENIHNETYSLIDAGLNPDDDARLAIRLELEATVIGEKTKWMNRWMSDSSSRPMRLLANVCMEGLFFQSSFAIIFRFRPTGKIQNIIFANEQISKDEGIHTKFSIDRYNILRERGVILPSLEDVIALIREAVEIEKRFARYVLGEGEIDEETGEVIYEHGLNPELLETYIEILANNIMIRLGYDPIYDSQPSSLPGWLRDIASEIKSNFYEIGVGSYSQLNVTKAVDWKSRIEQKKEVSTAQYDDPESVQF